ncbi:MAG TPA: hypothetical protein VJ978_15840 [Nitriliruptoraceae bacterium]|nr:hypothetical protein [Nitriliruptoraceae bacterium]
MSVTMYIHHVMHEPEAMAEGSGEVDDKLRSLGHEFSERWFVSSDMSHALLIAEFGGSQDVVTHFTTLEEFGFSDQVLGNVFSITSADVVGDLDDEARAVLAKYDFVNSLEPMPEMDV